MANDRRQLSEAEKQEILNKYGRYCFVDGHPIDEDGEIEFHHIIPFSEGGSTDIGNMAPVCKEHHRRIGTLSLSEFRDKITLERLLSKKVEIYLDDVIIEKVGRENYAKKLVCSVNNGNIRLYFHEKGWVTVPTYKCPVTGVIYFYATIPIEYIRNDKELQPRFLVPSKVWDLYQHFRKYTQLAPCICRLKDKTILLFDGQHKAAAQILRGQKEIECKVYIDPDERLIKEANIAAHTRLRQMSLYTSITIRRLGDLARDYWEEWEKIPGEKSEDSFVAFLIGKGKRKSEAINMLRSAIYDAILQDSELKLTQYLSKATRARDKPLSVYTLQRSLLSDFIAPPPLKIDLEKSDELREIERRNIVRFLNILTEETIEGRWSPKANDAEHQKVERFYRTGCIRAWSRLLKDVLAALLRVIDERERKKLFMRKLTEDDFGIIRSRIRRLFSHKIWQDPQADAQLKVNEIEVVREIFDANGLTVEWMLKSD